ncbi:hypothetical protein [Lactobacillus delbrueckii]|uniref:hypothetical protein n=1 Tax=Lactobacillus delbrueckii TaxID=1584 RepID=UPI001E2FEBEC|nr:hypothetical protein [Lactobacillus delbrueckii]MCD5504784.1 hypothetical protein [Lactobacillus delbrueckii subsp. lactis]
MILTHSKKGGGEKLISVYPELIAFAIWLVSLALLTILRRIHVKNRKLEQFVAIVEQVLADYVALYRRIGFSNQEKQNIVNSIAAILKEKGFKLSSEDVAQIEKIVDSKLLDKVE